MATIRINVRAIVHQALAAPQAYLARVAYAAQAEWRKRASSELRASPGSVAAYQNAIHVELGQGTGASVAVALTGTLPNILEQGTGPSGVGSQGTFDLRTFLLRATTSNIRYGKHGMYLNVPFGMGIEAIAKAGGQAAAAAARALLPTTSNRPDGGQHATAWGGRLGAGTGGAAVQGRYLDVPGGARGQMLRHASDPLAGLVRMETHYQDPKLAHGQARAPQSTFRKWRTVSEGGRPWWSRGVEARRLAESIQRRIGALLQEMR